MLQLEDRAGEDPQFDRQAMEAATVRPGKLAGSCGKPQTEVL